MKKSKLLILCTMLVAGTVFLTACGMGNNSNGNNRTEAPYEDETNKDVNDMNNGVNNGTMSEDLNRTGNDLKDAGRNLMDSIKDTGDAIRDGVNNLGNGNNGNRTNP